MFLGIAACSSSGVLTDGRITSTDAERTAIDATQDASVVAADAHIVTIDSGVSMLDATVTSQDASQTVTADARIATIDSGVSMLDDAASPDASQTAPDARTSSADALVATTDAGFTNGVVGYWKFDETTGTAAADSSGNDNTGTLNSMSFDSNSTTDVAAQITFTDPRSLSFNGSTDFIDMGTAASTQFAAGQDFSLSAWIKPTGSGVQLMIFRGRGGPDGYYTLGVSTNVAFFESNLAATASTTDPFDGNWHFITGVRSSGTNALYVDGVQEGATFSNNDAAGVGTTPLVLGYRDEGPTYFYSGAMDDVRIYNRALSPSEVTALAAGQ